MRELLAVCLVLLSSSFSAAQTQLGSLPRVQVAPGGHYLQTEDGNAFFWLGDTAWELIHHTTRSEVSYYLHTRAEQGFNVIQTVCLSEFDGLAASALGRINARNQPATFADMGWVEAMQRPGGRQMRYLRELVESRPFLRRVRDPQLVDGSLGEGGLHIEAMRDTEGSYAMIYIPTPDTTVRLRMDRLKMPSTRAWWYDPRTGIGMPADMKPGTDTAEFRTPSYGPDWVLVLDDAAAHYAPPGLEKW